MTETIIDLSREFFFDIVKPILERRFPEETPRHAEPYCRKRTSSSVQRWTGLAVRTSQLW